MNEFFQENRRVLFGLIILLFILFIVLYFAFLRPLTSDLKGTERAIETIEDEVEGLKVTVENEEGEETAWDMVDIRKKVPAEKELDPFLLTLEEIEAVSGSRIENIDFAYDGELPEATLSEEDAEDGKETEEAENDEEVEEREGIDLSEIPEGLRTISVSMTVYSPDYEHFRQFLVEIYKSERIMLVDGLTFEKPAESQLLENPKEETISFTIDFLTFYYD